MNRCSERALIGKHFAGSISPRDERILRAHLDGCAACRAHYDKHLLLAKLDPQALPPEERIARGLGSRRAPSRRIFPTIAASSVAVAAALALFVHAKNAPSQGEDAMFTARGSTTHPRTPGDSNRIFVYDVAATPRLVVAGDTIKRDDALALAYRNPLGKRRLMVFGVDEHRHVYWFYPAWTREAEDPVAIAIEPDSVRHELPDAVRHAFDGTALEIHAVFVDEAISVKAVEAMLAKRESHESREPHGSSDAAQLPIPGAVESSIRVEIVR